MIKSKRYKFTSKELIDILADHIMKKYKDDFDDGPWRFQYDIDIDYSHGQAAVGAINVDCYKAKEKR